MNDILNGLIWGVPIVAILFSIIVLFKSRLDTVVWNGFTLSQWLMGGSLGLGALLGRYAESIATRWPLVPEVVQATGTFLIPVLVFLGVWYTTDRVRGFRK